MSLLSSFVIEHLTPALEQALIAHEPDVQEAILREVGVVLEQVSKWLNGKLAPKSE